MKPGCRPRKPTLLTTAFFARPVETVAQELVGALLFVDGVGGRVVETEAYDREDPASHSYTGPNARNAAMFGPAGRAYVYRSYGIHWCLNFVCGETETASAVLVRAIEPLQGLQTMSERRGGIDDTRLLCSGPGRLCQALGITRDQDGMPLDAAPFHLEAADEPVDLLVGPRIGITRAAEIPWRFGLSGSRFLSKPFRQGRPLAKTGGRE